MCFSHLHNHLKIIAENQDEAYVQSVRESWLAKKKEAEEREHAIWLKYQEDFLEQERKRNEIAAKAEAEAAAHKIEAERAERLRAEEEVQKAQAEAKAQAEGEAQALRASSSEAHALDASTSDPVAQALARIGIVEQKIDKFSEEQKGIKDILQQLLSKF